MSIYDNINDGKYMVNLDYPDRPKRPNILRKSANDLTDAEIASSRTLRGAAPDGRVRTDRGEEIREGKAMGTRHLIAVQIDGAYKVAQYGQWDGYPGGQGVSVLNFLRSTDRAAFEAKLRATRFASKEDFDSINARIESEKLDWVKAFPELSRDAGSKILAMIADGEPGMMLRNSIDFAGESLFCEWAYVIDFDKDTFEVFNGFNRDPVDESERFAASPVEAGSGYMPVKLAKSWPLSSLPTDEEFIAALEPEEAVAE